MNGKTFGGKTITVKVLYESYYDIIEKRVVRQIMNDDISVVAKEYEVSEDEAILLLRENKWNTKVTLEKSKQMIKHQETKQEQEEIECPICFETTKEFISLSCGHIFCTTCWNNHIQGNMNRGNILNIKCMEAGCSSIVTRNIIEFAFPSSVQRYNDFILKESVESHGNVFCPNPVCDKVIMMKHNHDRETHSIRCQCNQRFCVKCHGEYHTPATCEEVDKWNTKNQEVDDKSYLMLTIKHCFHCGCPSERISGCNHITCPRCRKEWCWLCGGDWSEHGISTGGYFSCKIYETGEVERYKIDKEAEEKRKEYEKYMKCFNGYINNNQKMRDLQMKKDEKMKEIEEHFKTKKNLIKQLEEIFDTIIMAKSWLKNSFIHLYYLDDSKMNINKIQKLHQLQQKIETESEHIINILFVPPKRYNVQYIFLKSTQMKEAVKVSDFSF